MDRATFLPETPVGVPTHSKSIQVFLPITLGLVLIAVVVMFVRPGVGGWVAFTLSVLLVVWMYLGRVLVRTTINLGSLVKNLQVKNFELIGKVKVAEETCKVKSQVSCEHEP